MELVIGVSDKRDGNMSKKWGEIEKTIENRKNFLNKLGIKLEDTVGMSLEHGTKVIEIEKRDRGELKICDGVITREKNLGLWVLTGDCLPMVFVNRKQEILGLAHLGWKGVEGGLAGKMVEKMGKDVEVYIGPGVRKDTYIKYGKKLEEFLKQIDTKKWKGFLVGKEKVKIDLVGYIKKQLRDSGVREDKIFVSDVDTIADRNYFSHYRDFGEGTPEGRFMTVVMMR